MARPSRRQQADRKKAAQLEKRDAKFAVAYALAPWAALADFVVVVCEGCGLEQTTHAGHACVVCGHDTSTTSPRHDSFKVDATLNMLQAIQAAA